jgi:hypothetical protein
MSSARRRLKSGESLSAIIDDFRRRLGIAARLLPMSRRSGAHPALRRTPRSERLARFPGLFRAAALRAGDSELRVRRRREPRGRTRISCARSPTRICAPS